MPRFEYILRIRFAILGKHSIPTAEEFFDALRRKTVTGARFPVVRLEIHAEPRDPTRVRPSYLTNDVEVDTTLWGPKRR